MIFSPSRTDCGTATNSAGAHESWGFRNEGAISIKETLSKQIQKGIKKCEKEAPQANEDKQMNKSERHRLIYTGETGRVN